MRSIVSALIATVIALAVIVGAGETLCDTRETPLCEVYESVKSGL